MLGGSLALVRYLVEQGADVMATTNRGETALSLAAAEGNREVAEYLESVGG